MKIIRVQDSQEAGKKASAIIIQQLRNNPKSVLGLATGATPLTTYQQLVAAYNKQQVSFKDVTTFNLDEYKGLPLHSDQSYRYYMDTNLFDQVDIDKRQTFLPDNFTEPQQYDQLIYQHGGIDLQILGVGVNGHIGFNEPGTSFNSLTAVVDLTPSTIQNNARFFNSLDEVPKQAISMGLKSIMDAKKIVLIALGQNKALAVKHLVLGNINVDWPCTILQKHRDFTLIVDDLAASELTI